MYIMCVCNCSYWSPFLSESGRFGDMAVKGSIVYYRYIEGTDVTGGDISKVIVPWIVYRDVRLKYTE